MVAARFLPADPRDRQRVDRYELVGEIASGGMATVYLARRAGVGGFQRFVAVKRLHPHLAHESEFVQMFLDEARLAASIHHPNVVSITEVGANERGYYLVMDFIEGDTLARLMTDCSEAGRVVPLSVGLRIVVDMLTGLHAAHELRDEHGNPTGLVHRDVSPQNVLVGLDGISRISDFGVARAASRLAGTRVGQLKGKIAYMAPEQAAGDEMLDRRADVFAAGIVLWELLTGRRLFRASNDAATLSRVVTEKIDPPIRYVEGLDLRISDVCMKALERPLSRRIGTAAQFAEMLESAATRAGTLASNRAVAAYMESVLGDEITAQREEIRRWVNTSDSDVPEAAEGVERRATSGHPQHEHVSRGFERSSSSSRTRSLLRRAIHDSDPTDLTLVAPRRGPWVVPLLGACVAILVASTVWFATRRNVGWSPARSLRPLSVPTQLHSRNADAHRHALHFAERDAATGRLGISPKPNDASGSSTSSVADRNALNRTVRPNQAGSAAGRVPVPSGGPDVDLSNPYR